MNSYLASIGTMVVALALNQSAKGQEYDQIDRFCSVANKDMGDAAKCKLSLCIDGAVPRYDDGITQANEIGSVIIKQDCVEYVRLLADQTAPKFQLTRSRAFEMTIETAKEKATAAILKSRVAKKSAKSG